MLRYRLIASIFLVVLLFTMATAQNGAPVIGTSQENACNEGGLFFRDGVSLCETEWHWECGWYVANWQNTGAPIPDWCGITLTTSPTPTPPAGAYCQYVTGGHYADFGAGFSLAANAQRYSDANCTVAVPAQTFSSPLIYNASSTDALNICQMIYGGVVTLSTGNLMVYSCV